MAVYAFIPGSDLPLLADYSPGAYRLDSDDQIRVITFGSNRLSGQYYMNDQGLMVIFGWVT